MYVSILFLGIDSCKQYKVFDNAIGFASQVTRLKNAVLGVRWITYRHTHPDQGEYKKTNTDKMFNMLKDAGVIKEKGKPINFFIRGHYANRSRDSLMDLYKKLNETNRVTFTLYSDEEYYTGRGTVTPPNIPEYRDVIEFLGPDKVHLQISDEIRADLDLHGLSNPRSKDKKSAATIVQFNFILLTVFITVKLVENFAFY